MKKWLTILIFSICLISLVKADSLSSGDYVNNTYKNILVEIDTTIYFIDLYDNSSGIFFYFINFTNNNILYNCNYTNITINNTNYQSNEFPLNHWDCYNNITLPYTVSDQTNIWIDSFLSLILGIKSIITWLICILIFGLLLWILKLILD